MKTSERSPIKDPPLRTPGQSVREERDRILDEKLEPPVLLAIMLVMLAALEWYRSFVPLPPIPWFYTAVALAAVTFALWRVYRYRPLLRNLRQGHAGELAVGQFLERLRGSGYQVFHDVVGDSFNVDHVLIGPTGVYTIETKTWSKPTTGDARVRFDGDQLAIGSRSPDRDPIIQAKAQAKWLRAVLEESCGRKFVTRPVIVFPGWFVEPAPSSLSDLWILEPKALPSFIERERVVLTPEDVKLASFHLARFIRAHQRTVTEPSKRWKHASP